jgi:hypothetical protein
MIYSLIPYILLALSLIANLVGFLVLVHENQTREVRNRKRLDERMEELERNLTAVRASQPEAAFVPEPARSGLNISKRLQAMRMFRRNEDVSHIAAALGVARREVELLIRVHAMTAAANLAQIAQSAMNVQLCTLNVQ